MIVFLCSCIAITIIIMFVFWYIYNHEVQQENFITNATQGMSLDNIDIYLINLDRNPDRLGFFIQQYQASDLNMKQFNRVSAVDGKELVIQEYVSPSAYQEIRQIEKTGFRTKHYQLTRGAIGCYLSHMRTYDAIAIGDADYGLIFEDDVKIDTSFFKKLNRALPFIPNDWDILLLSCYCISCEKKDETYYDTKRFFWLHCYMVKKSSAGLISKMLKSKMIDQQIDSELSELVTEGKLKIYCLKENISQQSNHFGTEIQIPLKAMKGINPYTMLY